MVNRNIEEALNLVGMQVHGNQAVNTSYTKQVGHKFCPDANSWLVLAVLSSPSEIWDDSVDGPCRGSFCRIDHKQQFHEVVGVGERALYKEYVATAN